MEEIEFNYTGLYFKGESVLVNKETGGFFTMQSVSEEWIKEYINHPIIGSSANKKNKMKGIVK